MESKISATGFTIPQTSNQIDAAEFMISFTYNCFLLLKSCIRLLECSLELSNRDMVVVCYTGFLYFWAYSIKAGTLVYTFKTHKWPIILSIIYD